MVLALNPSHNNVKMNMHNNYQ